MTDSYRIPECVLKTCRVLHALARLYSHNTQHPGVNETILRKLWELRSIKTTIARWRMVAHQSLKKTTAWTFVFCKCASHFLHFIMPKSVKSVCITETHYALAIIHIFEMTLRMSASPYNPFLCSMRSFRHNGGIEFCCANTMKSMTM